MAGFFVGLHYFRALQSQTQNIPLRRFMLRARSELQDYKVRTFMCSTATYYYGKSKKWEHKKVLLHCLNTISYKDLRASEVFPSEVVKSIWKHRQNKGDFQSLKDAAVDLNIDMDTLIQLGSFLTSFYKEKQRGENLKLFTPLISPGLIERVRHVVGLEIHVNAICFSLLSRDFEVLEWDMIPFDVNFNSVKPFQIYEMAISFAQEIPEADAYIFYQTTDSWSATTSFMRRHALMIQLRMALSCLLNRTFLKDEEHTVFHVKKSDVKKMFNLKVGGEGVSAQHMIDNLYDNEMTAKVDFISYSKDAFYDLEDDSLKERYVDSFLLSLAFMNLLTQG